jgi:hypothetical protein
MVHPEIQLAVQDVIDSRSENESPVTLCYGQRKTRLLRPRTDCRVETMFNEADSSLLICEGGKPYGTIRDPDR